MRAQHDLGQVQRENNELGPHLHRPQTTTQIFAQLYVRNGYGDLVLSEFLATQTLEAEAGGKGSAAGDRHGIGRYGA